MDEAYNQYASHVRRKNRSSTNLNRLTLAPLTAKFPLADADEVAANLPDHLLAMTSAAATTTSYLQGRSAPTTPGLISRSPGPYSRSSSRSRAAAPRKSAMKKSKSTTQLAITSTAAATTTTAAAAAACVTFPKRKAKSGYATPNPNHPRRRHGAGDSLDGPGDSDWLLRTGAVLSAEARDYKGQSWLVSRESSTSLAGMGLGVHDADAEAFERELARERAVASRMASRRGSAQLDGGEDGAEDDGRRSASSRKSSRPASRSGGRWSQTMTPLDLGSPHQTHHHNSHSHYANNNNNNHYAYGSGHHHQRHGSHQSHGSGDYFNHGGGAHSQHNSDPDPATIPGPDFVNLDEKLEGLAQDREAEGGGGAIQDRRASGGRRRDNADDSEQDDEAVVRKLVRRGNSGLWSMFGFTLFSVAETDGELGSAGRDGHDDDDEEEDDDDSDDEDDDDDDGLEGEEDVARRRRARRAAAAARALGQLEGRRDGIGEEGEGGEGVPAAPGEDEGGWRDAAWLLSVASRVVW